MRYASIWLSVLNRLQHKYLRNGSEKEKEGKNASAHTDKREKWGERERIASFAEIFDERNMFICINLHHQIENCFAAYVSV